MMGYRKFRTKPPKHKVKITRHEFPAGYSVRCSVCGRLGGVYTTLKQAENRKSTHDRGQDAGGD